MFEAVNPVIVDVSYLQWLCLQFPIYIGSRSSQAALWVSILMVGESREPCSGEQGWGWRNCPGLG